MDICQTMKQRDQYLHCPNKYLWKCFILSTIARSSFRVTKLLSYWSSWLHCILCYYQHFSPGKGKQTSQGVKSILMYMLLWVPSPAIVYAYSLKWSKFFHFLTHRPLWKCSSLLWTRFDALFRYNMTQVLYFILKNSKTFRFQFEVSCS